MTTLMQHLQNELAQCRMAQGLQRNLPAHHPGMVIPAQCLVRTQRWRFRLERRIAMEQEAQRQGYETAADWLAALFEFEFCAACGLDADQHRVTLDALGLLHAECIHPHPDDA